MVRWTQHVPREKVIPSCPDSPHWPPSLSWALVQVKGQAAMVAGGAGTQRVISLSKITLPAQQSDQLAYSLQRLPAHSPGHRFLVTSLITIQGSFPCSSEVITAGLEIESPGYKKRPRDSQESSPTPQFKSINSSALSLLYSLTRACQPPLSTGLPRQEYWSGLSFPSPGDLPDPGIKSMSPALACEFFTTEPPGKTRPQIRLHKGKGTGYLQGHK